MTSTILLLCLVGAAVALPQFGRLVPHVVSRTHQLDDAGQFSSSYQSSDGQVVQESGHLKPNFQNDGHVLIKQGNYQYTSPEGVPVVIHYTADEYGFHPSGSVIPVGPPALHSTF